MNRSIHSDFIIHWTGRDIERQVESNRKEKSPPKTELYIERLKNILKYGLWMSKDETEEFIIIDKIKIKRPSVARTCFTELRLSEAEIHARKFGRLGIGFKRFFLFDRLGCPLVYYHPIRRNWFFPPLLPKSNRGHFNDYVLCFLKPMAKKSRQGRWRYEYFDESEWRIIYSDSIRKLLLANRKLFFRECPLDVLSLFIDPKDERNQETLEYYNSIKGFRKPEYLIPLDSWFSMIIYPDITIKNRARHDREIRELIKKIKEKETPGCPTWECKNDPIELNLQACRNF